MLDALWMSAKRGTDTLSISVADGRTLLNGLVAARGDKDGRIDLGVPLPVVKGKNASQNGKPLRPVVGGANGPFARAGRGRDIRLVSLVSLLSRVASVFVFLGGGRGGGGGS